MKIKTRFAPIIAALLLVVITIICGCATIGMKRAAATTCKMETVEENIRQAIGQIDATAASMKELVRPDQSDLKNAYAVYAANVDRMDTIAMPLDHRINQINILGKDYFAEWEKEGDKYTNPQVAGLSEQRRADLSALYARISQANVGVMSSLHAYMSFIIETRMYLSRELTTKRIEAIEPVVRKAVKEGNDFKEGLGRLLTAMEQVKAGKIISISLGSDSLRTFNSACLLQAPADYCQSLEKNFFPDGLPLQEFSPRDFRAVDYPTDARTLFLKMYSPRHTAALAYCYFVSRGAIDQKKIDPSAFAMFVNGFSISGNALPVYEVWLKTDEGRQCRQNVENSVGLPVIDVKGLLQNKLGLVALNPLSLVSYKAEISRVTKEMKKTLNHERIHLLHANCPAVDAFAKEFWAGLDPLKKDKLKKDIPEYNWEDRKIAVRESLAFTYENDPAAFP